LDGSDAKPDGDRLKLAEATGLLDRLNREVKAAGEHLLELRQALVDTQRDVDGSQCAQLREANGQLVQAVLRAEIIAEDAIHSLDALSYSSQRDPLTDTPNRALMLDRMANAIGMARRHGTSLAVLFIDLDHLKQVNDTLGHEVGDQVLQLVAKRLKATVRDSDTVSRHGGDEFLVLLPEIAHASEADEVAGKILAALAVLKTSSSLAHFYKRLLAAGKPKRLALVALMRKIIVIANARLRDLAQQRLRLT